MDTDELLKDDFLADLIRKVPLENPSGEFVDNVMKGIAPGFQYVPEKPAYFSLVGSSLGFIGILAVVILIICTSDIPFLKFLWGGDSAMALLNNIFRPFLVGMVNLFSSKFITYTLLICISASLLFLLDKIFSRRLSV